MKAKMINEFQRGSDPKSALGIGIHAPRIFPSEKELIDYIIIALPDMFGEKIPKDILSRPGGGIIPWAYYNIIIDFLEENNQMYINWKGEKKSDWGSVGNSNFTFWPQDLRDRLRNLGYEE